MRAPRERGEGGLSSPVLTGCSFGDCAVEALGSSSCSGGTVAEGDGCGAASAGGGSEGSGVTGLGGVTVGTDLGSARAGGCFGLADGCAGLRGGVSAIPNEVNPTTRRILKKKVSIVNHDLFLPGNTEMDCLTRNRRG